MSIPNMDRYADLWLACTSHHIESNVEFGAAALEYMSKLYDLDTRFLRRESGNAILLAKQCVEARTPVEAASMVAERWRSEMQESAAFSRQLVELLGEATIKLNHAMQQRLTAVNREYLGHMQGVANQRTPAEGVGIANGNVAHLFEKMLQSGRQITEAWNDSIRQAVPQALAATSPASPPAARKPAVKTARSRVG